MIQSQEERGREERQLRGAEDERVGKKHSQVWRPPPPNLPQEVVRGGTRKELYIDHTAKMGETRAGTEGTSDQRHFSEPWPDLWEKLQKKGKACFPPGREHPGWASNRQSGNRRRGVNMLVSSMQIQGQRILSK